MSYLDKFKTAAAGFVLAAAATTTTAEAAPNSNNAAREQERRAQSSQTYQQAQSGGYGARDVCITMASNTDPRRGPVLEELQATGKAFIAGRDLGCEFMRVGGGYSIANTYDFTAGQAGIFKRNLDAARNGEANLQRRDGVQQQREDRKGSLLNQGREMMNDARGYINLKRQAEGMLRYLGK